jgi:hypothetical protein
MNENLDANRVQVCVTGVRMPVQVDSLPPCGEKKRLGRLGLYPAAQQRPSRINHESKKERENEKDGRKPGMAS